MNENNQDDFSFFAGGNRVKKTDPVQAKSPLAATNKWDLVVDEPIQENRIQAKSQINRIETPYKVTPEPKPVFKEQLQNNNEPIGNVGAELQKFRQYPQKKYDTLLNKMVLFNEEEYFLIRDLASEISLARKRSTIQNKGSLPRITENTIIRAALKAMFSKIGKTSIDLSTLQTEEALENYFNNLLK